MKILGIDPGNVETAYCFLDTSLKQPVVGFDKLKNEEVIKIVEESIIDPGLDVVFIEMIASYGMPVGKTVFDTCVFIGELVRLCKEYNQECYLITRNAIKIEICKSMKAKDSNIRQALIDIYGGIEATKKIKCIKCKGKGTFKKAICPLCQGKNSIKIGQLHGMAKDEWSALAVATTGFNKLSRKEINFYI